MNDFTHFSLFDKNVVVDDFKKLPSGGFRELLAELHQVCASGPTMCIGTTDTDRKLIGGTIHPKAVQVSFVIGKRFTLILYTRKAIKDQLYELSYEGNESAKLAAAALGCETK